MYMYPKDLWALLLIFIVHIVSTCCTLATDEAPISLEARLAKVESILSKQLSHGQQINHPLFTPQPPIHQVQPPPSLQPPVEQSPPPSLQLPVHGHQVQPPPSFQPPVHGHQVQPPPSLQPPIQQPPLPSSQPLQHLQVQLPDQQQAHCLTSCNFIQPHQCPSLSIQ